MRIVLPGGSGQLGSILAGAFQRGGHEVVVLSRTPQPGPWRTVYWDGRSRGDWCGELDGADAVINLAGKTVNCRYTASNRSEILRSRVDSAHAVGAAIGQSRVPPPLWIQLSTATIYAHTYDRENDELLGEIGGHERDAPTSWRFSIEVAMAWEEAAEHSVGPATRLVLLRSAIVLSPDPGGAFDLLLRLVRYGLGGRAGDGRQYVSWVHAHDFVRAVKWIIRTPELAGPVNLSSRHPLPNREFMAVLREAWKTPIGLPASKWMVALGARLLGSEPELVLKSRRVVPRKLQETGFNFAFPTWELAASDLCRRYRQRRVG